MDREVLAVWSVDAMRVVRDQLYRAASVGRGSGVRERELPFVDHWPCETRFFRGEHGSGGGGGGDCSDDRRNAACAFGGELPIWATEDVISEQPSRVSQAAADEATCVRNEETKPASTAADVAKDASGRSNEDDGTTSQQQSQPTTTTATSPPSSVVTISDLPRMANEVSSLLASMKLHLERQRKRRLDRLRPPSRIRRHWYIAAFGLPTILYVAYKVASERGGLSLMMKEVYEKAGDIYRDHVSEPLVSIYTELFTKSGRLDVTDRKAREDAIASLKKMIRSWLDESFPKMPVEEKIKIANSMDISLIENQKEESIKNFFELNNVVRMSLIEMQFIKKELMNALVAMDGLMGSNEINMQIAAMTPAVVLVMGIRRVCKFLLYAFLQIGKSKEETYASFRQTILDIERLLLMRHNPPSAPDPLPWGSARSANTTANTKNDNAETLSSDDLGMMMLLVHECRSVIWQNKRRFGGGVLRNVAEDLAELSGERGPVSVSQQLQIISRMSRTYPFMKVVSSGIPFDMMIPSLK